MMTDPLPLDRKRMDLREWLDFFLAESHVLQEFPELLRQQAANQPEGSVISGRAGSPSGHIAVSGRPWLRWINKPRTSARIMTILGHEEEIARLVVSANGTRLISVDLNGLARVWEYPSGRALFEIKGHEGGVTAVGTAASAIITGGADGTIRIWSLDTGNLLSGWQAPEAPVTELALSPDGKRLALSYPGAVRIWDLAKRKELACLEGGPPLIFSPNGRYLACNPRMYDIEAGHDRSDDFSTGGRTAFSPDDRLFADGGEGPIRLTDMETGIVSCLLVGHTHWIGAMAFSPDGEHLVSTEKHGDIKIWDVDPGASSETTEYFPWVVHAQGTEMRGYQVKVLAPRQEFEGHRGTISALAMLPDGHRFLTISMSSPRGPMMVGSDIGIKVWSLDSGSLLGSVRGHGDRITAFALTPDGRHAVTGDGRGVIKAWDIDRLDREDGADTSSGGVTSLEISPDGRTVVADTMRGKIVIETGSGRIVERSEWTGHWGKDVSDLDLEGGRWKVVYVPERRMLEVRDRPAGDPVARFVFSEDIERLDARGSLIAAGGSGTGNVYVLEFMTSGRTAGPGPR